MTANTNPNPPLHPGMTLTRVFDAPLQRVFDAFAKPEEMKQWFAPRDYDIPYAAMDVRAGGAFEIHMRGMGIVHKMTGTYDEVVPGKLIVWTSSVDDQDGKVMFRIRNTIAFADEGGKTRLTIEAVVLEMTPAALPSLDGMTTGWEQTLDKLAEFLAKR